MYKIQLSEATDESIERIYNLPHLCYKLAAAFISGNSETVVGLTQNLRLYLNDKLFSNECTSFTLSQSFLAFLNSTSGLSHELFIYDLNRALPRSPTGADPPKLASLQDDSNFNVRAVERGSRLVAINGIKTIL